MDEGKKAYYLEYYKKNKDKLDKFRKSYYNKNKEKIKEKARNYSRNYYLKNKDKNKDKRKAYIDDNKERLNENSRKWYIKNKEQKIIYQIKYLQINNYNLEKTDSQRVLRCIKRRTRYLYPLENHFCEFCGSKATEHHHNTDPIQVDKFNYVCHDCHIKEGKLQMKGG